MPTFKQIENFLRDKNVSLSPLDLEELRHMFEKAGTKKEIVSSEELSEILKIMDTLGNN